jgi:acyl carrier protein
MVPSLFIPLEALPLTPNGKVDRTALEGRVADARPPEKAYVAPRSPTEEALAAIWAETLQVERLGIDDDFFELGGHSLLATRLVSRIRKAFRVELPISSLFEATTVAKMGQVLIGNEPRPGQTEKVARLLLKVRGLSAEELREALAKKKKEALSYE